MVFLIQSVKILPIAPLSFTMVYPIDKAPWLRVASASGRISWLFIDGITGAIITFTGIPFSPNNSKASNHFLMVAVLGSKIRLVSSDKEVTDILTLIKLSFAKAFRVSIYSKTLKFLVIILTGCLYFRKTSKYYVLFLSAISPDLCQNSRKSSCIS